MLTNVYNAFVKGRKVKHPVIIKLSELAHKQFSDELIPNTREVVTGDKEVQKLLGLKVSDQPPMTYLSFKTAKVYVDDTLPKDSYRVIIKENDEDGENRD